MNWFSIFIAGIVYWFLGAVWYGVFGKTWMKELRIKKEDLNPKNPVPYVIAFVSGVMVATGILVLLRWGEIVTAQGAVAVGFASWLAFSIGSAAKHYAFSGWSLKLFLIDYGLDLVGFIVSALILFFMGI